jgi:hypothetical protein
MNNKIYNSIDRAIALLETPKDYEKYISIKISPPSGCCCSGCWPETWKEINKAIAPSGPVDHEGDAIIEKGDIRFVLEQHESGPEILIYLGVATASILLIKEVISLMSTVIKGVSNEHRNPPPRIKISKRQIIKGIIEEEKLIEIDIPVSKKMQKQLEEKIKKSINKTS